MKTVSSRKVVHGIIVFLSVVTASTPLYSIASSSTLNEESVAPEIFILIPGIKGESQDADHWGWIDARSISMGVNNLNTKSRGQTNAIFQPVKIIKAYDVASPHLSLAAATGTNYPDVCIHFKFKTGDLNYPRVRIALKDVTVTSVEAAESVNSASGLLEQASFMYTEIRWKYIPTKPDGSTDAAVVTGFDLKANKPVSDWPTGCP